MTTRAPNHRRRGQSLIESCIAIAILSLLLFGMLQISQLIAAKEIMNYAAARGARAKTVGFNRWMVRKVVRLGAIANAGPMLTPSYENENRFLRDLVENESPGNIWSAVLPVTPRSPQFAIERSRMPEYLGSPDPFTARGILDYRDWNALSHVVTEQLTVPGGDPEIDRVLRVNTEQNYGLWVPMHRAFYNDDSVRLRGQAYVESHYPLYIDDLGW